MNERNNLANILPDNINMYIKKTAKEGNIEQHIVKKQEWLRKNTLVLKV